MNTSAARRVVVAFLLGVGTLASGCSEEVAAGACVSNDECGPGQACDSGKCRQLCVDSSSCGSTEVCSEGVCQPGRADVSPPVIEQVDADGSPDGVPGHSAHRLQRHLIILGDNLDSATVTLNDGIQLWPTEICEVNPSRLVVALPPALPPKTYSLSVSNAGGNCGSALTLAAGTTGPSGATGPSGPVGEMGPGVATGFGLTGDGSAQVPLAVDFESGVLPREVAGQRIEAEVVGTSAQRQAEPTASNGQAYFGDKLDTPTDPDLTVWSVSSAALGRRLAVAPTAVTVRVALDDVTAPPAVLATLRCKAQRLGQGSLVEVGTAIAIRPVDFAAFPAWRELGTSCNFAPTDLAQQISIDGFAAGYADVLIDYVRLTPGQAEPSYTVQRVTATSGTGASVCAALGGLCVSARVPAIVYVTWQGFCAPGSEPYVFDDCTQTLTAGVCESRCDPQSMQGTCQDRRPTYSTAPPEVTCLIRGN